VSIFKLDAGEVSMIQRHTEFYSEAPRTSAAFAAVQVGFA